MNPTMKKQPVVTKTEAPAKLPHGNASARQSRAFTARELLAVLAIIGALVCVQLCAFTNGSSQSKIAQCTANVKQYVLVAQLFGSDNNNKLPAITAGNWPWDMSAAGNFNTLLTSYGLTRRDVYDPGFPQQNIDQQWNYSVTYSQGIPTAGWRVLGYASTLPNAQRVAADDLNINFITQHYTLNGSDPSLGPAGATVHIDPSQRVLFADATISGGSQTDPTQVMTYQWTLHTDDGLPSWNVTPYGPWIGSSTSHMGTVLPLGGNVAMLDGHVEWRPFTNMIVHSIANQFSDVFWW